MTWMSSSLSLPSTSRASPVITMAGSRFFPKSPTTTNFSSSAFSSQKVSGDPIRASVVHLLARAHSLPCSATAQAFMQLVQPTARFQLALDLLLPLLTTPADLVQRVPVSFILYSMYAPHSISLNPFKSVLYTTFVKERELAINISAEGGFSEREQLVWVLWKILKGDGNDIGPYSPSTLTKSPLPPELRASSLFLDEETFMDVNDPDYSVAKSTITAGEPEQFAEQVTSKDLPPSVPPATETNITSGEDRENERIAQAMKLLLAARDRALTLTEQRTLTPLIPRLTSPTMITSVDLPPIVSYNPNLAYQLVIALLMAPPNNLAQGIFVYLDALTSLPPTLPSFDFLGRLLREPSAILDPSTGGKTTIADIIRSEVLGRFIHESIRWLESAEREEREGLVSDDRFAKGVQNLCRFYSSLLKLSIVDAASDAHTAEMVHFTLRNSRFEEANVLYRIFASERF
ncbi:hypothetical protein K503DRAFT_743910 [Rhizopogon vinicolor AM-OR11-026]|uniref:Uncharacterized protein n=1 Tax=Rhizopogon vinicolor AM-OR11-026 TaxID=1314800 RepID=A0A1B7MVR7_9AGAM|nr:hypothetical protein K503DRAFT_743910 [Rhizopogon vinicolor AM-OR11-026]